MSEGPVYCVFVEEEIGNSVLQAMYTSREKAAESARVLRRVNVEAFIQAWKNGAPAPKSTLFAYRGMRLTIRG